MKQSTIEQKFHASYKGLIRKTSLFPPRGGSQFAMVIDSSHLKHRKTIACRFAFWTVMATCNDVYLFPAKRLCDGSFLRFYGAGLGLE